MNDVLRNTYDVLPYESHAFPQTHPDRLSVVARLFGMQPAPLAGCRVLELGCGTGANLIPMAATMPDATFLGIDLRRGRSKPGSPRRRAWLDQHRAARGRFRAAADDLPVFDFIIAHGVFSWVPQDVQEALLRICSREPVAARNRVRQLQHVPGWRMRGTIRDFMLYHVRQFSDPLQQTAQARALLDFMAQSVPNDKSAFSLQLKTEVEDLRKQPDAYLLHDFLEPFNQPVYFFQFVERANAHALQYLGESEFATMLPSNLSTETAETLRRIAPDLVRTEQFMDFLRNRQFRQTLLVHRDVNLTRQVDARLLQSLEVGSAVQPVSVPVDERSQAKAEFKLATGQSLTSSTPITKAAFVIMGLRFPRTAPFTELRDAARGRLGTLPTAAPDPATVAADTQTLALELMQCAGANLVELRIRPASFSMQVRERPLAWLVARQDARVGPHVSNLRHETVTLDEFNRQLLLRLDGTRDRAALVDEMVQLVMTNQLAIQQEGVEVRDPATVRAITTQAVDQNLVTLARVALFPE